MRRLLLRLREFLRRDTSPAIRPHQLAWCGAAALTAVLPLLLHLPWWLGVITLAAGIARPLIGRHLPARSARAVIAAIAMLGAGLVYMRYGGWLGRDAGAALLVLMLGFKFLESRSEGDAYTLVLLSYFLVVMNFFYSQSIVVTLYAGGSATLSTAALVALTASRPPTVLGPVREAAVLLLQSLPPALLLFLMFPRLSVPFWGTTQEAQAHFGLSEEMSARSLGSLARSDEVAFRVSFPRLRPAGAQLYWRGPVLWRFDGHSWRRGRADWPQPELPTQGVTIDQIVTLEPQPDRWLLALDVPTGLPEDAMLNRQLEASFRHHDGGRRTYQVSSMVGGIVPVSLSAEEWRAMTALPADAAPRAKTLAAGWKAESPDDVSIVRQALRQFAFQPYRYTLTPPEVKGDPVDGFLFDTRRGYCEHYASAFTVLMRAAGIPARVVTGYVGGEWNEQGEYVKVVQSRAHAWSEVWLRNRGWIRIDPTAAVSFARVEPGVSRLDADLVPVRRRGDLSDLGSWMDEAWDYMDYQWTRQVLAYDQEAQQRLFDRYMPYTTPALMAAAAIALFAATYALAIWLHQWSRRRSPQDRLQRLYLRLCRRLARRRPPRVPGETARDYVLRLVADDEPARRAQALAVVELYYRLRYGRETTDITVLERMVAQLPTAALRRRSDRQA